MLNNTDSLRTDIQLLRTDMQFISRVKRTDMQKIRTDMQIGFSNHD
jgi:hypothetical protein